MDDHKAGDIFTSTDPENFKSIRIMAIVEGYFVFKYDNILPALGNLEEFNQLLTSGDYLKND